MSIQDVLKLYETALNGNDVAAIPYSYKVK